LIMDLISFKKLPILGIVRGIEESHVAPLTEAMISSGLETAEITMNTPNAPLLIKKMLRIADRRLAVGAGTVLTMNELHDALDAGATFIVMPTFVPDVLEYCVKYKIPTFPGGLTPQEVHTAWRAGATMVKIFPAKFFGPDYFKELKAPFRDLELLACGGVTPGNMKDYFANGAGAVSFGASVFRKELLEKKDFKGIAKRIKEYIDAYRA